MEPNWEALTFPEDYATGRNHFGEEREIQITPSKYVQARLKCFDDRFAANPRYIFHALDWIKRNAVASLVHFAEGNSFNVNISIDQLVNYDNVKRILSDDQIFSSLKSISGTNSAVLSRYAVGCPC